MQKEGLKDIIKNLPDDPGVYRFLNAKGKIIYIGKAKNLKRRVSSYFVGGRKHSYRIHHMVERIEDIAFTITNSEIEALLLENNLIKSNQPKYNILLKDGKTFPYICIKNERFPRVFSVRNRVADGSLYFGPYTSVSTMNAILDIIRGFIKLRNCNFNLSDENIKAGKFKICMEYQIGNCAGPCAGNQEVADYDAGIEQIKHILKGNFRPVLDLLKETMDTAAGNFEFEKADYYKRKIEKVKEYKRKNTVVSPIVGDLEVLTVMAEGPLALVNHFKVKNGSIIQTHAFELKRTNQEEESEILQAALGKLLNDDDDFFTEIVTNVPISDKEEWDTFKFTVPQKGDKKHLVDLSMKNCKLLLTEKLFNQNFKKRKTAGEHMVEELQQVLHLKSAPDHIECIDNSNFHGTFPVASLVVFKNGKAAKRDYRHYNIKTVEGPDDFASMYEVVTRRFTRLIEEEKPFPKLMIVDGGKGQLSSAVRAMKDVGIYGQVPIIGIAKRLEEIYVPGDSHPLYIDKKSGALRLIQQMRDEAHRFAITHHRNRRSKATSQRTGLVVIKGIGETVAKDILKTFKSVKKLKAASEEELTKKLGAHKAGLILKAIEEKVI